jgi:hypothetical protein
MYSSDYRASDSMRVGSKGSPTTKYAYTEPMLNRQQIKPASRQGPAAMRQCVETCVIKI